MNVTDILDQMNTPEDDLSAPPIPWIRETFGWGRDPSHKDLRLLEGAIYRMRQTASIRSMTIKRLEAEKANAWKKFNELLDLCTRCTDNGDFQEVMDFVMDYEED